MEEKLNLDGIHLDMSELINKYEGKIGSVSDGTEIQQIALFTQQNPNHYRNPVLNDMINPMFAYAGLYPHTQKAHGDITILDHVDLISEKPITEETRKLIEKMRLNSDLKAYTQNFLWFWDEKKADEVTDEGRKKLREVMKLMSELGYTPLVSSPEDEIRFKKINKGE